MFLKGYRYRTTMLRILIVVQMFANREESDKNVVKTFLSFSLRLNPCLLKILRCSAGTRAVTRVTQEEDYDFLIRCNNDDVE